MPAPSAFAACNTSIRLTPLLLLAGIAAGAGELEGEAAASAGNIGSAERAAGTAQLADFGSLQRLLDSYTQSMEMRQYQEAEAAAKQRIEYLLDVRGAKAHVAEALHALALAQHLGGQHDTALLNYFAAIGILENVESGLSEKLIKPLRGVGDTYMATERADLALPAYDRALHLTHVNEGPHSLDQVEILDALMEANVQLGDFDTALAVIDRMHALHARQFATDSEEMLPVLERRARLLNRLGRHQDERLVYLDIVRIIEASRGENDVGLIEPYTAMGRTYLHEVGEVTFRSEPTGQTGETYLKKAVMVARSSPEANWLVQEQALIELGDYYTIIDVQDKARRAYRDAWQLLSADDRYVEQRRKDLENVALLIQPGLDRYANFGYRSSAAEEAAYTEGHILARFKINDRGRVTDIEIVEADPADFSAMEIRVQRTLRESIYRPRHEDGRPVITENQLFRHDFLYVKD